MLCMNWVCEGTLDDHELVSENTIAMQVEEMMDKELDCELCIPCAVPWSMLWFSAPARLNQTMEGEGINIVKYHEVVNMAITETITLPLGDSHTPRTCMLRSLAAVSYRTPQRLGCEQGDDPLSMMVAQKILMNDVSWNH